MFQGILGLGFGDAGEDSTPEQKTWFEAIFHAFDEQLFTLSIDFDGTGGWNFGHVDPTIHTGEITYIALDNRR